ncbi:NAD(P)-binding protein [Xylariaceae sp. AK1471]|nr:NAD(P)-binding protein [Xylariaceae sp. AK1471]
MTLNLKGTVAIIAGALQIVEGIRDGRATAFLFATLLARLGAKVALVDFDTEWAQETKRRIDEENGISEVIQVDLTDEDSSRKAVAKTVEVFEAVHTLVNIVRVAGVWEDRTHPNLEAWDRSFRINFDIMVLMTRHAIPEMRKNGKGTIFNMSLVDDLLGGNPSLLYPSIEGAINDMTNSMTMAGQYGPETIRVMYISSGMIWTPTAGGRGTTDEERTERIDLNMLEQERTGWDVECASLFLCGGHARWTAKHKYHAGILGDYGVIEPSKAQTNGDFLHTGEETRNGRVVQTTEGGA